MATQSVVHHLLLSLPARFDFAYTVWTSNILIIACGNYSKHARGKSLRGHHHHHLLHLHQSTAATAQKKIVCRPDDLTAAKYSAQQRCVIVYCGASIYVCVLYYTCLFCPRTRPQICASLFQPDRSAHLRLVRKV